MKSPRPQLGGLGNVVSIQSVMLMKSRAVSCWNDVAPRASPAAPSVDTRGQKWKNPGHIALPLPGKCELLSP